MKKIIFTLLCFLYFSNFSFTQSNFVAGTITKPDGTVVTGQIDYREWTLNPTKINFRASVIGRTEIFTPTQIKEFSITTKKEFYKSATVFLNKATIDESKLIDFPTVNAANKYLNDHIVKENVFLLTLIKGEINLYSLYNVDNSNEVKENFFIQKGNDTIIYLKNSLLVVRPDETHYQYPVLHTYLTSLFRLKEYISQLKTATEDCPNLKVAVDSFTKYKQPDVVKCVKAYNNCKGNLIYTKNSDRYGISIYLCDGRFKFTFITFQ